MKVALLYPPPWKLPSPGQAADPHDGPPEGHRPGDLDADFYQTPYGLFALGAAAIRAGHAVKVINMSAFTWDETDRVLQALDADVFGMSCWTANRRGVALCAAALKRHHPKAQVIVGGPHATPFAKEMLAHHADIDLVCKGESDETLLELLERLEAGKALSGVAGTVYRDAQGVPVEAAERPAVADLDALACPQHHFDTHILMTSRGCPWACTFCGAETTWGRGFRGNSVDYTLSAIERVLPRLPVKMIQIKDDTFTTNKKRVLELCRKIRERDLKFFWSCDTRVDLLSYDLLKEMRLAGCQRLSLGVESGSQRILDAIEKKITVQEIIDSTEIAKSLGIKVRYFMMLGNRGETRESFEETLRFLERARPHEYIFSCLSVYPGTKDFRKACETWLDPSVFFTERFQELKTPFDASEEDTALMNAWFQENSGLRTVQIDGSAEYRAILDRLGDHHAAHMDLGAAYYAEGQLDLAEEHVLRAQALGYPLPGLVWNHLACIAKARGDLDGMMDHFSEGARVDPQHYVLIQNVQAARAWFKAGGPSRGLPLKLVVRHDFQLLERTAQPTLPGPLPPDFATWAEVSRPEPGPEFIKTPELEGSKHGLKDVRRLKLI
jgi:radical SAM superfamily enzyme YgiQ (UPF0313 family)